jgi:uncharacterized membrane protein
MFPLRRVNFRREVRDWPSSSNLSQQVYSSKPTQSSPPSDAGSASVSAEIPSPPSLGFAADFRRFFVRGLAAVMPTLITLWLLIWAWNFLWTSLGSQIILGIRLVWMALINRGLVSYKPADYINRALGDDLFGTRVLGVLLAVLLVYIVGVFVGNLLGRTAWRLAEHGVMKIPLLRAIYPAVKQITDFVLSERSDQFQHSTVVAVQPHEKGIWSIGLVTGSGVPQLSAATGQEMVTVFVPSSPTAFSGYVLVVPKASVVQLPLKVEDAMRLLVSGGVLAPELAQQPESPGQPPLSSPPGLRFRPPAAGAANPAQAGVFLYNPPAMIVETKEQKS